MIKTREVFVFDHKAVDIDQMTRKEAIEAVRLQAGWLSTAERKLRKIDEILHPSQDFDG